MTQGKQRYIIQRNMDSPGVPSPGGEKTAGEKEKGKIMMNKKLTALVLALVLVLALTGCQSKAAKAVDEQIWSIGTVTLNSGDAIAAAEAAAEELSQKDYESLKNLELLAQARADYEHLLDQEEAKAVDAEIGNIGAVGLDSGEAIAAARSAYDSAEAPVQALVSRLADLEAAEGEYLALRAAEGDRLVAAIGEVTLESGEAIAAAQAYYDDMTQAEKDAMANAQALADAGTAFSALKVEKAIALINAIGKVKVDSAPAIAEAQAWFDGLTAEEQGQVTNAQALADAHAALKDAQRAEAEKLLNGMRKEEDRIRNMNFYYPSCFPFYSDGWAADSRCFALPYLGQGGDEVWLRWIFNYTYDSWVFFEKIIINVDGENHYKFFNYFDVVRDNAWGDVWEYVDLEVGEDDIALLQAIADSKSTLIRFEGDEYYWDFEVKSSDKTGIRQILKVYDALSSLD